VIGHTAGPDGSRFPSPAPYCTLRGAQSLVDLTGVYRVWNPRYKSWSVFSQDHLARVLLDWRPDAAGHDAVLDALKSVRLFNLYSQLQASPDAWQSAQVRNSPYASLYEQWSQSSSTQRRMVGRTCERQLCQAYAQPLVLQAVVNARKPLKQCPMQWCLRGAHSARASLGRRRSLQRSRLSHLQSATLRLRACAWATARPAAAARLSWVRRRQRQGCWPHACACARPHAAPHRVACHQVPEQVVAASAWPLLRARAPQSASKRWTAARAPAQVLPPAIEGSKS